jgi:hypothetical protein
MGRLNLIFNKVLWNYCYFLNHAILQNMYESRILWTELSLNLILTFIWDNTSLLLKNVDKTILASICVKIILVII